MSPHLLKSLMVATLSTALPSFAQTAEALRARSEPPAPPSAVAPLEAPAPVDLIAVPLLSTSTVNTQFLLPLKITDSGFVLLRNPLLRAYAPTANTSVEIPMEVGYRWRNGRFTPLKRDDFPGAFVTPLYDEFQLYAYEHEVGHVAVKEPLKNADIFRNILRGSW